MTTPKPSFDPNGNSATIAPTTENAAAVSSPTKMRGEANGISRILKLVRLDAPYVRSNSWLSCGTDWIPRAVATVTGKNVKYVVITVFVTPPVPSQRTNAGAIATMGTAWAATMRGMRPLPTNLLLDIEIPVVNPNAVPTRRPIKLALAVDQAFLTKNQV